MFIKDVKILKYKKCLTRQTMCVYNLTLRCVLVAIVAVEK